uniref:Uncharacterized protein n=1 Tax=Anguilla anguilla TaxID=7936 RepID=A0A0E9Q665_ANGAN
MFNYMNGLLWFHMWATRMF